jgi:hypothetical protein
MKSEAVTAVLAVLIVASLGIGYLSGSSARSTKTVTSTATIVSTTSLVTTAMITSSIGTTNASTVFQLYHQVTFNETGCLGPSAGYSGPAAYVPRWYVTMDNVTIVQPSNATLPFPNSGDGPNSSSPAYATISKIVFTVPNGSYTYNAFLGTFGANGQGGPVDYNGTITVNGSDVVVPVSGPLCSVI